MHFPLSPFNKPLATAFSRAGVDQLFGISVNSEANTVIGNTDKTMIRDKNSANFFFFTLIPPYSS